MSVPRKFHLYRQDRDRLRVAQIVEASRSEGPEVRFCLWLQGCDLRCPGCCNPEMFDFASPAAIEMPVADLVDRIRATPGIEGITLLGGEPFHQAPAAGQLAARVHDLGLGVVVFSGYEFEALTWEPHAMELLAHTDLLIAGPYIAAHRSVARPWVGSDNQQVHFLTPRYREHPAPRTQHRQSVHVQINDGEVRVSGWPGVAEAVLPGKRHD